MVNFLEILIKLKTSYLYRDGFIDNEDLHDMLASLGKVLKALKLFEKSSMPLKIFPRY